MAWALAISIIFGSVTLFFIFMYAFLGRPKQQQDDFGNVYVSDDEHKLIRIGFLGLGSAFILYMMGTAFNILSISNVTDENILSLVDGISVILTYMIYLFMAYLFLYLFYYLYNKVMTNTKDLQGRMRRRQ